jgi:mannose-6-phosphate isomerase-like protein (cupin superfamily)
LKGYKTNIEKDTLDNSNFRKVLYTSKQIQLVLMTLRPGEEIEQEVHDENDQFFRIEGGHGKCIIDDNEYEISDGDAIVIPTGSKNNIINVDTHTDLKMCTLYALLIIRTVLRPTKKEAEENEAEFDGKTTE